VAPPDSIGTEIRGGQRFVKHRVGAGETLFGLARRYHVSVDQLTEANPQLKNGLGVGEVVLVPRGNAAKAISSAAVATAKTLPAVIKSAGVPTTYTVGKGETLFAIARKFQMTPAELIKLNNLPADGGVRVGQVLNVNSAEAAAPTAAKAEPKTTTPIADKPAQIATVTTTPAPEDKEENHVPTRASEVVTRVTESGMGAIIEKSGTDKYLALHKTAPVGTIMQVKNMMSGQSVYVRVIGKLPDTGENNNILVRISPRAVQKLGTADQRFRVETSYVP
jgi:LysM repeat protein